jgi:Caspase domain
LDWRRLHSPAARLVGGLLGLFLAAGLAACTSSPPPGPRSAEPGDPSKPRADRPTYDVGQTWNRGDGVYRLTRIERDLYVFEFKDREIHLSRDLSLAAVRKGKFFAEFDPAPRLSWPLEVGKRGVTGGVWRSDTNIAGAPSQFFWEVAAYEEVDTVAGRFKAFRIDFQLKQRPVPSGPSRGLHMWYAPEVKQIVKLTDDHPSRWYTFEVVSVSRPTVAPLRIVLDHPRDQLTVGAEEVRLDGKVTSGKGIARVSISVSGEARTVSPVGAAVPLDQLVKLKPGKNVLLVTATAPDGETTQTARTLHLQPPGTAAPPALQSGAGTPPAQLGTRPTPVQPRPAPSLAVNISAPKDQSRFEQESVALAGFAAGGRGPRRLVVTLNGLDVTRQEESGATASLAFHTPVSLREGQNTLVVTATDANGTTQQEARTVYYEKPVPLSIAVRYPEDKVRVQDETSVVAALVTGSKGIALVRVDVNGAEVSRTAGGGPSQKSMAVTAPTTLREGVNVVVVSATDAEGTVRQEIRTITYAPPAFAAAAAAPAPASRPAPARWAVIIGVGDYESRNITKLRYATRDAEAVYQVLTGPGGFKAEHVLLLTDKTERKPTLRNIRWALGTLLARSARKEDTVVIFFAGHGAPEVDPRGLERDGLAKYLAPIDVDPDDLFSSALAMDDIQTIFSRIEAERVVVFIDACYSGAAGGRTFSSTKTRAAGVDDLFLERLTRSKGRAIVTASRPSEVSIELSSLGHGVFTYYLVEGLKGAADANRDGIVSLQELYEYVEQEVSARARSVGGNQHPMMKGELEGPLPLVRVGPR